MEQPYKYTFDAAGIERIHQNSAEIESHLKSSFDNSKTFFSSMIETDLWTGQLKDEFLAYYHLVLQYHGWLIGEKAPSIGSVSVISPEMNSCGEINDSFKKLIEAMGKFESESDQCASVKEIL